jgi:Centromere-binding protein ParB C-terminal
VPSTPELPHAPEPEHQTTPSGDQVTRRPPNGGRRVQRTINFERDLLERARAACVYMATEHPDAGIRSLADIVNSAVAEQVAELEARFNDGNPFHPVTRMPAGRRPGITLNATPDNPDC